MEDIRPTTAVVLRAPSAERYARWRRALARSSLLGLLALPQLSCETGQVQHPDPGETADGETGFPTRYPPEDLGTWVTLMQGPGIAWSADGSEIFHLETGATCPPLVAMDIRNRSTRVATDSVCAPSSLRLSADGAKLFFQIIDQIDDDSVRSRIYGVSSSGGSAEMHVERVLLLYVPFLAVQATPMNTSFAVSTDGSAIAYLTAGDSLYVHDVADQTTQVFATGYSGPGEVLAFSPDGTEIVHYSWYSGPVELTSLTDGSTVTIWDQSRHPRGIRWHEGDIHILDITFEGDYYIWNVTTGQSTKIAELKATPKTAWSDDGTRVAAWVEGPCLEMQGDWVMGRCTAWQYTLHLIDTRSSTTVQIGQGNFGGAHDLRVGGLVFSPDRQSNCICDLGKGCEHWQHCTRIRREGLYEGATLDKKGRWSLCLPRRGPTVPVVQSVPAPGVSRRSGLSASSSK